MGSILININTVTSCEESNILASVKNKYYSHNENITEESVKEFLFILKNALRKENKEILWSLMGQDCRINKKKSFFILKNKTIFLKNYLSIFNKKIKQVIFESTESNIFVNSSGMMMGNGEIWFEIPFNLQKSNYEGKDFKIKAFNIN